MNSVFTLQKLEAAVALVQTVSDHEDPDGTIDDRVLHILNRALCELKECTEKVRKRMTKKRQAETDTSPDGKRSKLDEEAEEAALDIIGKSFMGFGLVSTPLRDNFRVALAGVESSGRALQYASERLRGDPKIVCAAIEDCATALEFASLGLRDNIDIVKKAVSQNMHALEFASERIRSDSVYVLSVIETMGGDALEHASLELKASKEIVMASVKRPSPPTGSPIRHADSIMQTNLDIAMAAVEMDGMAIAYVGDTLLNNQSLIKRAVEQNGMALEFLDSKWKSDTGIVAAAVKQNEEAIVFAIKP